MGLQYRTSTIFQLKIQMCRYCTRSSALHVVSQSSHHISRVRFLVLVRVQYRTTGRKYWYGTGTAGLRAAALTRRTRASIMSRPGEPMRRGNAKPIPALVPVILPQSYRSAKSPRAIKQSTGAAPCLTVIMSLAGLNHTSTHFWIAVSGTTGGVPRVPTASKQGRSNKQQKQHINIAHAVMLRPL